jgi:hypothetical protein
VLKEFKGYHGWITIALAIYRATSGSNEGFELFDRWCRKNTREYKTRETLEHIWYRRFPRCPPITIGVGTLFAIVDDECPGWQAIYNEEHGYDDDDDASVQEARHD